MAVDHVLLRSHWQLMKNAAANDLYAGLAKLSRELYRSAASKNYVSASHLFLEVFHRIGFAESVLSEGLNDERSSFHYQRQQTIRQEDIVEGKQVFEVFARTFKPSVCSQQGILGLLYKGTVNTEELPVLIATHILNNHLGDTEEWYSFSLLIATLLNEQGIEEFCNKED